MNELEREQETAKELRSYDQMMRRNSAVPVVCIGVNEKGQATICMNRSLPVKQVVGYLNQLAKMLEGAT